MGVVPDLLLLDRQLVFSWYRRCTDGYPFRNGESGIYPSMKSTIASPSGFGRGGVVSLTWPSQSHGVYVFPFSIFWVLDFRRSGSYQLLVVVGTPHDDPSRLVMVTSGG